MRARVKFSKGEEVKYVGHLDLMRTFIRCIKRTCIPVAFSKGFNPRVQISFALPLGVGVTSSSEFFDLEVKERMNVNLFLGEMNSTLPQGLKALEVTYIDEDDKKSLMSLVKEAIYEITVESKFEKERFVDLFYNNEITIEKETKRKNEIQEINLKDFLIEPPIIEYDEQNNKVENSDVKKVVITVHSTAGSVNNMNPSFIIQAIQKHIGDLTDYEIHRKELILK